MLVAVLVTVLGVAVPNLFHILGLGAVFLPMYLPLALGAFILSRRNALMAGVFTPLISALMTGMPPWYPPIAFMMSAQMGFLCLYISVVTHARRNRNRHLSPAGILAILVPGLLLERMMLFLLYSAVLPLFGIQASLFSAYDIVKGLPGVLLLCAVVPFAVPRCVAILSRYSLRLYEDKEIKGHEIGNP
jgi:hypothetical protein